MYIYIYTVIFVIQKSLNPPLPGEVAVSFYVHATKLVFALYHVNNSPNRKLEITDRFQVSKKANTLREVSKIKLI